MDTLLTLGWYAALAYILLVAVVGLTFVGLLIWDRLTPDYYSYDNLEDFSPWEDWDYPIPDDNASWGDLGEDLNEWKRPFDQERES